MACHAVQTRDAGPEWVMLSPRLGAGSHPRLHHPIPKLSGFPHCRVNPSMDVPRIGAICLPMFFDLFWGVAEGRFARPLRFVGDEESCPYGEMVVFLPSPSSHILSYHILAHKS